MGIEILEIPNKTVLRVGVVFGLGFMLGSFLYKLGWFLMAQLVHHQMTAAKAAEMLAR